MPTHSYPYPVTIDVPFTIPTPPPSPAPLYKAAIIFFASLGVLLLTLPAYSIEYMLLVPACLWVGVCRYLYRIGIK